MRLFETELLKGKTVPVTQKQVFQAWRKVRTGGEACGVDGVSLPDFELNQKDELYKLWNRMASGSYKPMPVRAHGILKDDGTMRILGIPAVSDRIAQQVVRDILEPTLEQEFLEDNYGYRPGKSAHQAVEKCTRRSFQSAWVIDMDIKGFFDNMDHDLTMKALVKHTQEKWILLYVKRWLTAPVLHPDGTLEKRVKGIPQGGVISPLLSNLFLHYAFDKWMAIVYTLTKFERYADDIIVHCGSLTEATSTLEAVSKRLESCHLMLHPLKTKIVYCKHGKMQLRYKQVHFDFLGFRFQPRKTKTPHGKIRLGFGPAISPKSKERIITRFRKRKIHRVTGRELDAIAHELAPQLRGWINYFGKFRKWEMYIVFRKLNDRLVRWLMKKYKRYRNKTVAARQKLKQIARDYPNLFVHWQHGFLPG